MVDLPDAQSRWRCTRCGNLTRFDVQRTVTAREYWHAGLSGDLKCEEQTVLREEVQSVTCRWCGANDTIITVPKVSA